MEPEIVLPLYIRYLNLICQLETVIQIAGYTSPFDFRFSHKYLFIYFRFICILGIVKACLVLKDHNELTLEPIRYLLISLASNGRSCRVTLFKHYL